MKMLKFALQTHEFEQTFFETGRIVSAFRDWFLVYRPLVFGTPIGWDGPKARGYATGAVDALRGRTGEGDHGHVATVERPPIFRNAGQFDHGN